LDACAKILTLYRKQSLLLHAFAAIEPMSKNKLLLHSNATRS